MPDQVEQLGTQPPPPARVQRGSTTPVIVMHAAESDRFMPYFPVSGLTPDASVRVQVDGFGWHERGTVQQCVVELATRRRALSRSPSSSTVTDEPTFSSPSAATSPPAPAGSASRPAFCG